MTDETLTDEIQWAEPPSTAIRPGQHAGKHTRFAKALRDNPGSWAIIEHGTATEASVKALAQNLRRGKVKGFEVEDGEGEFTTALDGMTLYVRFLPTKSSTKPTD